MVRYSNLVTIHTYKNKLKDAIGEETILELARNGMCPHYILINPLTKEETILFQPGELTQWMESNFLKQMEANFTPSFHFNYFNRQLHTASNEDIPEELSRLGNDLFRLNLEYINTPPGIYFLCKGKEIVYIGQSTNIAGRIVQHLKEAEKEFDNVYFIVCPILKLDEFESALIRYFQPPLNRTAFKTNSDKKEKDVTFFKSLCKTA